MPTYRLEELKWTQLNQFNRDKTLFVISVSPLEEHGPHLPVGVDLFNAEFFSDQLTERFLRDYPDWSVVSIPSFPVGSFAFHAPGSLIVQPRTIRALLTECLSSLAKFNFKYFLISNAHGGPTHIAAIEEAAQIVSRRYRARVAAFTGHLIWNFLRGKYWDEIQRQLNLSKEESDALKEDAHAGQWETSMMLKLKPSLVEPDYKKLDPSHATIVERFEPNYPLKRGNKLGYIGSPALASEKLAEVSIEFLREKAYEFVRKELFENSSPGPSMFYRAFFFRTNFIGWAAFVAVLIWCLSLWL